MTTSYSLYDLCEFKNDNTDDLFYNVEMNYSILTSALRGAIEINDRDLRAELVAEMDLIESWMDTIAYCDENGIDCEDSAEFMAALTL